MTRVGVSAVAVEDLDRMILTHSLPDDTGARVRRWVDMLERFPRVGRELEARWQPFRFILGPWRWMLIVYDYDEPQDLVVVATIQDAMSSSAVASTGRA